MQRNGHKNGHHFCYSNPSQTGGKFVKHLNNSRRSQFAGMGDLALAHGANLGCLHRHHCRRFAGERGKFHLISAAVTINVNHRAHVPGYQSFLQRRTVGDDVRSL